MMTVLSFWVSYPFKAHSLINPYIPETKSSYGDFTLTSLKHDICKPDRFAINLKGLMDFADVFEGRSVNIGVF